MAIRIDAKALFRWEYAFGTELPALLHQEVRAAFQSHGRHVHRRIVLERLSGRPGLIRRTGDLARSVNTQVHGEGLGSLTLDVNIGRHRPQAAKQEVGGRIQGKPRLLIPLDSVKTQAGVPKFRSGLDRRLQPTFIIQLKGKTFVAKSFKRVQDMRRILGRVKRLIRLGASNTVLLFKLQEEVRIPRRMKLRELWFRSDIVRDREVKVQRAMERALRRAGVK